MQHPSADASDVGANVYAKTGTAEIGVDGSTNLGWICGGDLDDPHWTACIQVNFVENRGGSDVNAAYLGSYVSQLYTAKGGAYVQAASRQKKTQTQITPKQQNKMPDGAVQK